MSEVQFTGRVRVLPESPSKQQVKDYLNWLARSQFMYHIDDDPEDIIWDGVTDGITDEEVKQLRENCNQMWAYDADFLWDNYPWKVMLKE